MSFTSPVTTQISSVLYKGKSLVEDLSLYHFCLWAHFLFKIVSSLPEIREVSILAPQELLAASADFKVMTAI
jgi:hypothetical protein